MVFCMFCVKFKIIVKVSPSLRPILSAIETLVYKSAKFLVHVVNCVIINKFTIGNFFLFTKYIFEQGSSLFIGSFDVHSFFTNILLEETITICSE